MKASKIIHRNEIRIRVDFPYNQEMVFKLRQIADSKWSKTFGSWHIPYTMEAFKQLKELFPDVDFDSKTETTTTTEIEIETPQPTIKLSETITENTAIRLSVDKKNNIVIDITEKYIYIKMPKNEEDIVFIRSFKYNNWDSKHFCWLIPNYKNNAEKIKKHFEPKNPIINTHISIWEHNYSEDVTFTKNEMLVINDSHRVLRLHFSFKKEIVIDLKKIPYCKWNSTRSCWEAPYSEKFIGELKQIAHNFSLDFIYKEQSKTKIKARTSQHLNENYRQCPEEFIAKLNELRYSKNTLASYKNMFEEFINYYSDIEINDISDEMIVDFLRYLVNTRNVSGSYQNQSINAIKFYFERVLGGQRKVYTIDRPRKEKFLPEVLSEEEVVKILKATDNLKHKAIIMTIYSSGLRISELVNLKIKDIDSNRMQIRVEQAKGNKDRYTLLGIKTLEILRKYFAEYKPKVWLFEGIRGEQYSTSSIQANLKKSVIKAGIKKRISVHTLRHSFATHLLESGTDIRYIQNLLGHGSSKTTEIYTHITTKGFDQIKSPLDNLNFE